MDYQEKIEELQHIVVAQQREIEEREGDILRWSNIAYNLATALCDEMIEGSDGPPKPICWAPCDCTSHKALDEWGNAQVELLNEVNPGWHDEMLEGLNDPDS